jgi:putative oxidoreductase
VFEVGTHLWNLGVLDVHAMLFCSAIYRGRGCGRGLPIPAERLRVVSPWIRLTLGRVREEPLVYDGWTFEEATAMRWERLIRFILQGSHELEEYAILVVRVALGLFFAISGANKLFVAQQTQVMYETLVAAHVPLPRLMTYFVSSVEFLGGLMLIMGFLSSIACVALLGDMLVAILTTKLAALPKGVSPLNWLDNFLYLPEALYVLFFVWLICSGPGRFSIDSWIRTRLRQ